MANNSPMLSTLHPSISHPTPSDRETGSPPPVTRLLRGVARREGRSTMRYHLSHSIDFQQSLTSRLVGVPPDVRDMDPSGVLCEESQHQLPAQEPTNYECKIEERSAQPALTIRAHAPLWDLPQLYEYATLAIIHRLEELGERPAGPPFAIYYNMSVRDLDVEIGFPVGHVLWGSGDLQPSALHVGTFCTTRHRGQYDQVDRARAAAVDHAITRGYEPTAITVASYLTCPQHLEDETLVTRVSVLVEGP